MKKKKELPVMETADIIEFCAYTNKPSFNANKALEEATEFMEVLLKLQTKADSNPKKPTREQVLEEYSHTVLRGFIKVLELFPEYNLEQVDALISKEIEIKCADLIKWQKQGLYKKGL